MQSVEFRQAVLGVVQGVPGAADVLRGLRHTLPGEYERLVLHLYKRGPRGSNLCEKFKDDCDCDALVLGRDLLAQASEHEGWNVND